MFTSNKYKIVQLHSGCVFCILSIYTSYTHFSVCVGWLKFINCTYNILIDSIVVLPF